MLLRMRYILGKKKAVDTLKTDFPLITFFENPAVYGKMWKNIVERDRPHKTISYGACALSAG